MGNKISGSNFLNGFLALILPFGDLIVRVLRKKGSLDKWWTIPITSIMPIPFLPGNLFGAIMHGFGFIGDGKADPLDIFMIIPIICKLMVMLGIWLYTKMSTDDEESFWKPLILISISLIVPCLSTFIPLVIRAYNNTTCTPPATANFLNIGADMVLCNAMAAIGFLFLPCFFKFIPYIGSFLDMIPKPISGFIIWCWIYASMYCIINMVNNYKADSYCTGIEINNFFSVKAGLGFCQVMLLVAMLCFKDTIYTMLECDDGFSTLFK
jgi:hypothetical protein